MTVEQATAIARWKRQPYTPTEEASVVLADEVERLQEELAAMKSAIIACLDENGHLADGDICTLYALKGAVPEWRCGDDE